MRNPAKISYECPASQLHSTDDVLCIVGLAAVKSRKNFIGGSSVANYSTDDVLHNVGHAGVKSRKNFIGVTHVTITALENLKRGPYARVPMVHAGNGGSTKKPDRHSCSCFRIKTPLCKFSVAKSLLLFDQKFFYFRAYISCLFSSSFITEHTRCKGHCQEKTCTCGCYLICYNSEFITNDHCNGSISQ